MFAVKRNSREFKELKEVFEDYEKNPARKRLIRLFALKPSEKLEKRVSINDLKVNRDVLYEMNYQAILEYFVNRDLKLYREDKQALYYFKKGPGSDWMEYPFELLGKLKKKFFPLKKIK